MMYLPRAMTLGPGGDGFDLEQDVGHSQAGNPDDGLRGRRGAAPALHDLADYPELLEVGVHHVRPELDDVAEVEPVGGKGDTQVAERLPHLLGEVGRDNHAVRARSVLTRDKHQLRAGRDGGGVTVAERDRIVKPSGLTLVCDMWATSLV